MSPSFLSGFHTFCNDEQLPHPLVDLWAGKSGHIHDQQGQWGNKDFPSPVAIRQNFREFYFASWARDLSLNVRLPANALQLSPNRYASVKMGSILW